MTNAPVRAVICGEIATVTFNRPQAFNAFDLDTITTFMDYMINFACDGTVRAVIISGEGKTFCAGGDLKWIYDWPEGYGAAAHNLAARFHQSVIEIRRMRKPVIAAVNGPAAGGGFALAIACDFRIMEKSAVLRQAYTSNGLSMDGGSTYLLPRIVGLTKAMEIAAFDKPISADEALKMGLVTRVVEDGASRDEAAALARKIMRRPMESFASSKQLMADSFEHSLESHLELERAALKACASSPDGAEGVNAFYEKRKPVFGR